MAGFGGEAARIDADPAHAVLPLRFGLEGEHRGVIGRQMQPAIGLDLVVELAGRPARIAEREDAVPGPAPVHHVAQDVDGGGERVATADDQARIVAVIGRMENEALARFDRAAVMDRLALLLARLDFELMQKLGERHVIHHLVDDDAHRALGAVGAQEHHAAGEARVFHMRHRHQQVAGEITRLGAKGSHGKDLGCRPPAGKRWLVTRQCEVLAGVVAMRFGGPPII